MIPLHTLVGLGILSIIAFPYIHIGLLILLTTVVELLYEEFYFMNRLITLVTDLILEIVTHPFFIIIATVYFYSWLNNNNIL